MAGEEHCELRTKRGKIFSYIRVSEMALCRGILVPKRCARFPLSGTGLKFGIKGNGCNTYSRPQQMFVGTSRYKGGRYCDGAGRQQASRHDSPLHAEEMIQRGRMLGEADEERGQTGDWKGRIYT